jgi:predicted ATP-grasp superfamily ATP-dependent carboligase
MSAQPVEIKEIRPLENGGYKAVFGLAGAGFIGNTSTMFAARSKTYRQIAWVKSNYIPPMTLITNGAPMQSFRIHFDESEKIIFVITESLVPAEGCWPIAEALTTWLKGKGVVEMYSIDGLPFANSPAGMKAFTYSSRIDISNLGFPALKEGALSGINSCILEECAEKGYPYASIFIPTNKLTSIDYSGSADAVDVMNRFFKLGVDPSPLRGTDEAQKKMAEQRQTGIGKMFTKT